MLQRKQLNRTLTMFALLLLAAVAAGAANLALVAFVANRMSATAGAAGEFVALTETTPAARKLGAVKVGNENVPAATSELAA